MPLATGETVGDRYRVVRPLGQGGMGAVYQAWDTRLNRPIALKEMSPQAGLDAAMLAELRSQFQQEAQVLATLSHPNLVRVSDYFSWNNAEYLVMDYVEGESLASRIRREGPQQEAQVLVWTGQLLEALAYCHKQGVLHRDIKPQNIIITPQGKAMVVDFGLVKLWNPNDPRTRTAMRGMGTPEYAPPEQYDTGPGHTDPRSDVYGLGATLYHAVTGQLPPTATQRMASPSSFMSPRRVNPAISSGLEGVILRSLEIAKDRRFQSADDMALALGFKRAPATVVPRTAPPPPPPVRTPPDGDLSGVRPEMRAKPKRKGGIWLGLGLVVGGLVCVGLAIAVVLALPSLLDGGTGTPEVGAVNTVAATASDILFRDDFSDPASGWEVGGYDTGGVGYKDGAYYVMSMGNRKTMWGVAGRSFTNAIIDVDATQVSAPANNNNGFGVVCRDQGDGNGYYLLISGDGMYSIQIAKADEFQTLVDWAESPSIRQGGATNHIQVVCDGTTVALYTNGTLLATTQDSTYSQGDVSLTTTSYESEPSEIHFDNLVVRRP